MYADLESYMRGKPKTSHYGHRPGPMEADPYLAVHVEERENLLNEIRPR